MGSILPYSPHYANDLKLAAYWKCLACKLFYFLNELPTLKIMRMIELDWIQIFILSLPVFPLRGLQLRIIYILGFFKVVP